MYVVLKESATSQEILELKKFIQKTGHGALEILDGSIKKIGIMGKKDGLTKEELKEFSIVKEIIKIGKPFKFVSREFKKEDT
ncbi:MAG: 3-deoxy-7-phosphoheptulonate synthase, partial [Cetobacterium sp.]